MTEDEEERSKVVIGIKRRQYYEERKRNFAKTLSYKSVLKLGKKNNSSQGLISHWKKQYQTRELNSSNNNQGIKKLQRR